MSLSFCSWITLQKTGKLSFTILYSAKGLPLQRLERAQVPCLIMLKLVLETTILHSWGQAPQRRIRSLNEGQSPEMLPIAQMACSTISIWLLYKICTIRFRPPLSIIDYVCYVVPEAMLVMAQVDSSCSWGYSWHFISSSSLGTVLASITSWTGEFFSIANILRIPITP